MRYHYTKPEIVIPMYNHLYFCKHPVYDECTLFKIDNKGLAVIQQRFDPHYKMTWWGAIDEWLAKDIYLNQNFKAFFDKRGKEPDKYGLYPTVTVRQIMWALRIRPLKKQRWETVFDHKDI